MLKAGADLSDKSLEDLLSLDAKEFEMGSSKVIIAQVNAVDVNDVLSRQAELELLLNKEVAEKGLDLFFFVVTDILNNNSVAVPAGYLATRSAEAFGTILVNNQIELKGIVSRKKQIVPTLTEVFQ